MKNEQFIFNDNDNNDNNGKHPTPFLFVPYYKDDNGGRPLPPSILSWNCPGILINGVPYKGTPLQPEVEINLTVVVRNSGRLGTACIIRVFWADPTAGFLPKTLKVINQSILYMPATTTLESPVMKWTPTNSMPAHSCILVEVTSPMDNSSGIINVNQDRHYAQTNINILQGRSGEHLSFEFNVTNNSNEENEYIISIQQLEEGALEILEKQYNAEAVDISLDNIELRNVRPGIRRGKREEMSITLPPNSQELCQAIVRMPLDINTNQFIAFGIHQIYVMGEINNVVGTIGAIVFAK